MYVRCNRIHKTITCIYNTSQFLYHSHLLIVPLSVSIYNYIISYVKWILRALHVSQVVNNYIIIVLAFTVGPCSKSEINLLILTLYKQAIYLCCFSRLVVAAIDTSAPATIWRTVTTAGFMMFSVRASRNRRNLQLGEMVRDMWACRLCKVHCILFINLLTLLYDIIMLQKGLKLFEI
jgi:hypothetical protein